MQTEPLRTLGRTIRLRLKAIAMPFLLLCLAAWFGWQATQGNHGLIMREQRKAELKQAEDNLAIAKQERDQWVRKVAGLTPSHLDRDAIDQRARELLNMAAPDEIVVPYGPGGNLF